MLQRKRMHQPAESTESASILQHEVSTSDYIDVRHPCMHVTVVGLKEREVDIRTR